MHFRFVDAPTDTPRLASGIAVKATLDPPALGDLRIVVRQRDPDGSVVRSNSIGKMGSFLMIRTSQAGREIPVEIRYDSVIWSGLSWGVGELRHDRISPDGTLRIELSSGEGDPALHLEGRVYSVQHCAEVRCCLGER